MNKDKPNNKVKTVLKKSRKEAVRVQQEFFKTISGMMTAAFGLVAALAWNDAVKRLIDRYVSSGQGIRSAFIYAAIVTIIAVLITYYLGKIASRFIEAEGEEDKNEKKEGKNEK